MKKLFFIVLFLLSIWIAFTAISVYKNKLLKPDIVIVLSGNYDRIYAAINLAKKNQTIPIWISGTESDLTRFKEITKKAGLPESRFALKLCAVDTVTNFTCIVDELSTRNYKHAILITSDYHMTRALIVGNIILGSKKIAISPKPIRSQIDNTFPLWRIIRDTVRSIMWITTGINKPVKKL